LRSTRKILITSSFIHGEVRIEKLPQPLDSVRNCSWERCDNEDCSKFGVISLRDLLMVEIDEKDEKIEFLHSHLFTVPGHAEKKYKT